MSSLPISQMFILDFCFNFVQIASSYNYLILKKLNGFFKLSRNNSTFINFFVSFYVGRKFSKISNIVQFTYLRSDFIRYLSFTNIIISYKTSETHQSKILLQFLPSDIFPSDKLFMFNFLCIIFSRFQLRAYSLDFLQSNIFTFYSMLIRLFATRDFR